MTIFNQHGKAVANGVLVSDIIHDHLSSQELFVKRKLSFSTREEFLEQRKKCLVQTQRFIVNSKMLKRK